ncbi:MAG: hypothetical protein AAF492_22855 [Verrucomicrobiota bacterium]
MVTTVPNRLPEGEVLLFRLSINNPLAPVDICGRLADGIGADDVMNRLADFIAGGPPPETYKSRASLIQFEVFVVEMEA